MNHQKHYNKLIHRAKTRTIDGYVERHHVMPRCVGGSDDPSNIVELTPEEHYVAHQLLIKLYPDNQKLIWAAHRMTSGKYRNNRLYGWIRKAFAESMVGNTRAKGYIATKEHKEKNAAAKLGENNPMYGKDPWNKGIKTGIITSSTFKSGYTPWITGKNHTNKTKKKMSNAAKKPITINGITYSSRSEAADMLDISRNTLYNRINCGTYKAQ